VEDINESNTLRLNRQPYHKIAAVGLQSNYGIFIQEYWRDTKPYYAIANTTGNPVSVDIAEWVDGKVGNLLISWETAPSSVQSHEIQDSILNYKGSLLAISLGEAAVSGLLRKPETPVIENRLPEILTIEGLNGVGERYTNIQCWQPQLVFNAGEIISLTLRLPQDFGIITLNENFAQDYLPRLNVFEATSQTLGIKKINQAITISGETPAQAGIHEASLLLKAPVITNRTMASFAGRVNVPNGGGFSFARGVIIDNPE
jgi:hypothetical protein